jgi:hypothetical protein
VSPFLNAKFSLWRGAVGTGTLVDQQIIATAATSEGIVRLTGAILGDTVEISEISQPGYHAAFYKNFNFMIASKFAQALVYIAHTNTPVR